jgi:ThiF family/Prokaryotic homologs of the JAB domain
MSSMLRLAQHHSEVVRRHLFPGDGKEAIALLLCGRREGEDRRILTVREVATVPYDECSVRTPDRVVWSTDILDRLMAKIWTSGLSIVKIHSHPRGYGRFSPMDDESDAALSLSFDGLFAEGRLHGSAIMLPDGFMFGRELIGGKVGQDFRSVMIAGDDICICNRRNFETRGDDDLRNRQAFGAGTVSLLRSLRVAVIGNSGTGSIVVEQLGRLGVGEFVLVDPDAIEAKNLNRILNASSEDARRKTPKVLVAKRMLDSLGRDQEVMPLQMNLDSIEAVHRVAECDVIFGCVDTAEGRNLANRIAAYYVIPYIDVGVRLVADGEGSVGSVSGAVNYYKPGGSTLLERGAITSEQVRAEEMRRADPARYREMRRQGYIKGIEEDRPAVISVNAFFAALAVNEFLARIHRFRNIENSEFSTVRGDLCEFALHREPEEGSNGRHLLKEVGVGDCDPLIGRPSLSVHK